MSPPPARQLPPPGRRLLPFPSRRPSEPYQPRISRQMQPQQGGGSYPYHLPRSNTEPTLPSSSSSTHFARSQEEDDQQIYYEESPRHQQPTQGSPALSFPPPHHVQYDYEDRYRSFPPQDQQPGPSSRVQFVPPPASRPRPQPPPHLSQYSVLNSEPRAYFPPPPPPPPIRTHHSYSAPVAPLHYQQQHHPQPHSPPSPFSSYSNSPPWPSSHQFGASPPTHQAFLPPASLSPVSPQTNLPPPLRSPSSYTSSSFNQQTSSSSSEGSASFAQIGGPVGDDEVASETGLVFETLEVGEEGEVATLRQTVVQTGTWLSQNLARHGKSVEREGTGTTVGKAPGKRRMTEEELAEEDQSNDPTSVKRRLRNIQNSRKFRDKRKEYISELERRLSSTLELAESLLQRVEDLEGSSSSSAQPKQEDVHSD